jgi:spoIIIJ-associated protein
MTMTADQLCKLFQALFKHMAVTISCEAEQDGEVFLVNLTGPDTRFIEGGKDNRTGALLTIIKLMVKQQFDIEPKIVIDFNNQRKQRLQNVAQMAKKTAELVRLRGGEEELRPMTPAERRAVHMELKQMEGVKTESRGEEPHRRIVIMPADAKE